MAHITIAKRSVETPRFILRIAVEVTPRHSPSNAPMRFATSKPTARLSGQPMDGPRSPRRGVAAPYRNMLPPHSRPIEMLSPQLRIEREKINFVVLLRLIKSRQYTRFGIDPAA